LSGGARRVSLREYLHAEIAAVEQLSQAPFDAMQRAVDKALEATDRRFEGVNEFRATLSDQADEHLSAARPTSPSSKTATRQRFGLKKNERKFDPRSKAPS
jgi:hypothetical protein